MRATTIVQWLAGCIMSVPPIDELIAAGLPVAAVVVAAASSRRFHYCTMPLAAHEWGQRASQACFGPDRVRLADDVPAGIVLSALVDANDLDEVTSADDGIRLGYTCPGKDAGAAVARLRERADPEALAVASPTPLANLEPACVIGWATYCAAAGPSGYLASFVNVMEAVSAGNLDPELALAIIIHRVMADDSVRSPVFIAIGSVLADAFEAHARAHAIIPVLPPIVI